MDILDITDIKITKETKIGDLIPDGYELDNETIWTNKTVFEMFEIVFVMPLKKVNDGIEVH